MKAEAVRIVAAKNEANYQPLMNLQIARKHQNLECSKDFLSLTYPGLPMSKFESHLKKLIESDVDPFELAALFPTKQFERFDSYADDGLLTKANGDDRLDFAAKRAAELALDGLRCKNRLGDDKCEEDCDCVEFAYFDGKLDFIPVDSSYRYQ